MAIPLRIAVLSSTRFGKFCIEEGILDVPGIELAGIATTPPEIDISYSPMPVKIATHTTFDDVARRAGCEVEVLSGKITATSYLDVLARWRPDMLLALGWYYIVPRAVRQAVPHGCAGIHASLLPLYRGGAPIPWAIINGEEETGVSFFYLEDGVDTGDIIAQERLAIHVDETCATVYARAEEASARLLLEHLPRIAAGTADRTPQDQSQATVFPQRKPSDGRIDWRCSVRSIHDFVRAQTKPYPGAYTTLNGRRMTIWMAQPAGESAGRTTGGSDGPPTDASVACGTVVHGPDGLFIRCGDGWLNAKVVEIDGIGAAGIDPHVQNGAVLGAEVAA